MKNKGKMRPFPGPRGPQMLPQPGVPGAPGGPEVRQKITEIDWYKWRLAHQKEQTLVSKQNEIQRYKDLLAKEEENLRLRITLLRMENKADIGHLNLGQGDQVLQAADGYYVVRAPRPGPYPPVNKGVEASADTPIPSPPDPLPLPPVPSASPDEGSDVDADGGAPADAVEAD